MGWFGAPVNRMFTVTWSLSGSSRHVNRELEPMIWPSVRSCQLKSSRPTVTGPATASSAAQVAPLTTPLSASGGWREPWNSRTARRVAASNVPFAVTPGRHLAGGDRQQLLLQLLHRGPS